MKVLVACEFSGIVRDAFLARGHDAISCDLLPSESPGPHVEGDVFDFLGALGPGRQFDMVIAHPPCTYLAVSGARWLSQPGRMDAHRKASRFFSRFLELETPRIAVENPVMVRRFNGMRAHDFSIQPWQFGHGEIKRTCFWTKNLPPLTPTRIVDGRVPRVHRCSPGSDRWKERSRTLHGVAAAMAAPWGELP